MTAKDERDRQRAVFAGAGPTIVAAGVLNFCVRYEYRCVHSAIITGSGSLTVIKSKNIGKPLKYGFFFVKFLFLYVVCVVIMI